MSVNFRVILFLMISVFVFSSETIGQDDLPAAVRPPESQPLENGVKFLKKANLAHGGVALDNLKTLRLTGKRRVNDHFFDVTILVDTELQKVREETKGVRNYFSVRQIEGNKGWSFFAKKLDELDADEQGELEKILYTSVLGLRSEMLKQLSVTYFADDNPNEQTLIAVRIKGEEYTWTFDSKSRLISQSGNRNAEKEKELYDDFRSVGEINMPHRSFFNSLLVAYSNSILTVNDWKTIEVNPKLTKKDWSVPN